MSTINESAPRLERFPPTETEQAEQRRADATCGQQTTPTLAYSIAQTASNDKVCQTCGFSHPAVVHDGLCYECKTGRKWEKHHLFGRVIPVTILLRANWHRILWERQREWPEQLRKPQTPLDWLALLTYSMSDLLWLFVELLRRVGAYLVAVSGRLRELDGENWHEQFAPVGRIGQWS